MTSGFQTMLYARKESEAGSGGRARWVLQSDLVFHSDLVGTVRVPAGFDTDFASVPRAPFAYWLAGDTAHASAAVHDYLCRDVYPAGITWRTAAAVFREAMQHEGVPAWRRAVMHWAVMQADPDNQWKDLS